MTQFFQPGVRYVQPDGTLTPLGLDVLNGMVRVQGGQGRDRLNDVATGAEAVSPLVDGVGSLSEALASQNSNITSAANAAANTSGLIVTVDAAAAFKSGSPGQALTTSTVTATASGGGTPYTSEGWVRISGSTDITATAPGSAASEFTSPASSPSRYISAVFCYRVEESGGETAEACVNVSFYRANARESGGFF